MTHEASATSFHDVLSNPTHGQAAYVENLHLLGSERIGVANISNSPEGSHPEPPMPEFLLSCMTRGSGDARFDLGAGVIEGVQRAGMLALAPPRTAMDFNIGFTFDVAMIALPELLLRSTLEAVGITESSLERLHCDVFHDPLTRSLVDTMLAEARADNPNGSLYVDQTARMLAVQLGALAAKAKPKAPPAAARLSDAELARVRETMLDRMDERVNNDELAALVGRDPFTFLRAFKVTTGTPPYKYLLGLRIARARELLTGTALPISEIAFDCGFCSQAHLTSTFRDHVGIPPGEYRKRNRN